MKRTLAIVGAGRVGRALGRQLAERGWAVGPVVARSPRAARAAVRAIGDGAPRDAVAAEIVRAHLILVTVPDDAIATVARRLARLAGSGSLAGRVVLHTSGAVPSTALAPLAKRGASVASMHPMQTFAHGVRSRLAGVTFAIEGDRSACRLARRLALDLGAKPVIIHPEAKALYHAAGAFASPHLLAALAAGEAMLEKAGFRERDARGALLRLARQTLENYERLGAKRSWTGPVSRGDRATIRHHEAALKKLPPEFLAAYRALTRLQLRVLRGAAR
jgi:predicted short-subunit dehydrogenase-like oxidoreductase (DUF2520 family)